MKARSLRAGDVFSVGYDRFRVLDILPRLYPTRISVRVVNLTNGRVFRWHFAESKEIETE